MTVRKKLIEVALPLNAINKAAAREKSIRHGHPSTLHLWWARRPLAAARAVIFAQMVDDPSAYPNLFPTEKKQEKERLRLFKIVEDLVRWENTTNEKVLEAARDEIWASWRRACAENAGHPRAKELFDRQKLPAFHDPFAGGGALPLEAQRLGLEAHASDLNPVAVLINKAMIEIPPKFAGKPPVSPEWREKTRGEQALTPWKGAQGLAEDVRYYGRWMRDEAEKRIGHLYPKIAVTAEMAKARPDLERYAGRKLTVIAWLWARTVKSPNPAFAEVDVPLASTFLLSTKSGKEAYVEPVIEDGGYRFTVKMGKPQDAAAAKSGTKLSRGANFQCLMSGTPIAGDYIKAEGKAGRMGARLMAIVAEGDRGRVYLAPAPEHEAVAGTVKPAWKPDLKVPTPCHDVDRLPMYGMPTWGDAFTLRQLEALVTFSDLVQEARERVQRDALAAGLPDDKKPLPDGGTGATAYGQAVGVYLGMASPPGRSSITWSARSRAAARPRRPRSSPSSAPGPRSPASWPTASTRSASARSAPPRRSRTTGSSRAGPRSPASPARAVRPNPSRPCCSRRMGSSPMSRLRLSNGDDHPDAARKHLLDAGVFLAGPRPDGAAYLSGYVVECALKSLHVLETGAPLRGHDFRSIVAQVNALATVAGARTARYFGPATSGVHTAAIGGWTPEMRYHAPSMALSDAQTWHACARDVFQETVHQMDLDGVL